MVRFVSLVTVLGLVASCTDSDISEDAADKNAVTTPTPSPVPTETAAPSGARAVSEETDDFRFEYSYPAEAGNIPGLAALLDRRLERARATLARQSAEARADAHDNGFPYNKYSTGLEWQVVADLPGWLSLSGAVSSYTGGAHGNYGIVSLVWDKQAEQAMEAIDLFASPQGLGEVVHDQYCEGLDKAREARGIEPPESEEEGGEAMFPSCPPIEDLTVLVGSANGRTFDRLTLYAGPYVAGSYAEGAYEVNLPVTAAVLDAVKPDYRESFSIGD